MLAEGTIFKCSSCQTEIEVLNGQNFGGPLVCCEIEMQAVKNEYEQLWENEAYDVMDYQWD